MSEPITSIRTFTSIWIALLILTCITVGVAYLDLGAFSIVVALVIATVSPSQLSPEVSHTTCTTRLSERA